jgi:hypothetical protein
MFSEGLFTGLKIIGLSWILSFPLLMFSVNESKYDFNQSIV